VDTTKTITHLSLCSGYEGIGLGLRSVLPNLREIAYVEREGFPVANLVAKMEAGELDAAPVFTDVKTFPYRKFRGCVDILSGGFPCQPFSSIGKRKSTKDPRHLFPYIENGIAECQPRIVFLENVAGIISTKTADGESVLQYVCRRLEKLDYTTTAGIFSAREVGAPHQRKRVYILGMANSNSIVCGRWKDQNADDAQRFQKQKAKKQPILWSKTKRCSGDLRWPSRPNQQQRKWEEPRVTGQAEPKLGRTPNGSSSRVDRLRLLGNGVVPQTAAKAFTTLSQRLI